MKVQVFNGSEPKVKILKLELQQDVDGVRLSVVNDNGIRNVGGTLLYITDNGELVLPDNINKEFGFVLLNGRLKVH